MLRRNRWIAILATVAFAAGAGAVPAKAPVTRLGKTVVQYQDETVRAVLSWRYASQSFEKEPWLLLELAFAAEGKPVDLHREDVYLLTPGAESLPLPGQKRLSEGFRDVRWVLQKASVSRDPIAGYFSRVTLEQRLPFFTIPGEHIVQDAIGGGPNLLTIGDLFFEAPAGGWKPGLYTLILKNKTMSAQLPFHLPADEQKKDADGKTVSW